jgi:DNA replication protein DnaC
MAEPERAVSAKSMRTLERILEAKGIQLIPESLDDESLEESPGNQEWHRRARAEYALNRWKTATPPRFRDAEATLPEAAAWADHALSDTASAGALLLTGLTSA